MTRWIVAATIAAAVAKPTCSQYVFAQTDAAPTVTVDAASVADGAPQPATTTNPVDDNPVGVAKEFYAAIKGGEWLLAIGLGFMLLAFLVRKALALMHVGWAETRRGGYIVNLSLLLLVNLGSTFIAPGGFSFGILAASIAAAMTAAGGWEATKDAFGLSSKKERGDGK